MNTLVLLIVCVAILIIAYIFYGGETVAETTDTNASVAMVSLLFIVVAIIFGFCVYRRNAPMVVASIAGVIAIIIAMAIGMNFHPFYFSSTTWMFIVGIYIAIASVTPVWIL